MENINNPESFLDDDGSEWTIDSVRQVIEDCNTRIMMIDGALVQAMNGRARTFEQHGECADTKLMTDVIAHLVETRKKISDIVETMQRDVQAALVESQQLDDQWSMPAVEEPTR